MAKFTPEIDIITDTWEDMILSLNGMLESMSTEIITANATYANTGNSSFSRTAQLYGTFGANNLVVTNTLRGGNVNGSFTNLNVSTNVAIANATSTVNLSVSNGSVLTVLNHNTLALGNGTSNTVANASSIISQSSATVNTNITSTLIKVANATNSANMTSSSFRTGSFLANTTAVSVGANTIANLTTVSVAGTNQSSFINGTSLFTGNSTVNTAITPASAILANATHTALIAPNSLTVGTGTVFAVANSTNFKVSTSAANTTVTPTSVTIANTTSSLVIDINSVTGPLTFNSPIAFSDTITVTGTSTLNANVSLGDATADKISVNGRFNTSVIPDANTYALGATTGRWAVFANTVDVSSTLDVLRTATFSNTIAVVGSATLSNTLNVTGTTTISNTLNVTGVSTLSNNAVIGGQVTINNEYVIEVTSNTNLGATTGSPVLVYSFPKATYSSGKFEVQVKNTGNTQISELVLAHDGTNAYVSIYGTVASPAAANGSVSPLGTFTSNVNGANVELLFTQTNPNSAAKIVAHLIK